LFHLHTHSYHQNILFLQGLWSLYTLKSNVVTKDLVEIIYFDDNYAYVNGTISNGDKIILGGASKVVQGMVLDSK
jgi:hypothetical protein